MEKGRGSGREREACPQGNGCSMQCRGTMGTLVAAVLSAEGKGWGEALSAFSAGAYG